MLKGKLDTSSKGKDNTCCVVDRMHVGVQGQVQHRPLRQPIQGPVSSEGLRTTTRHQL